jgi:hypothetical protein
VNAVHWEPRVEPAGVRLAETVEALARFLGAADVAWPG